MLVHGELQEADGRAPSSNVWFWRNDSRSIAFRQVVGVLMPVSQCLRSYKEPRTRLLGNRRGMQGEICACRPRFQDPIEGQPARGYLSKSDPSHFQGIITAPGARQKKRSWPKVAQSAEVRRDATRNPGGAGVRRSASAPRTRRDLGWRRVMGSSYRTWSPPSRLSARPCSCSRSLSSSSTSLCCWCGRSCCPCSASSG